MLSLSKSKHFLDEYKDFQTRISKMTNEPLKKELSGLLSKLVGEVKLLDSHHRDLVNTNNLPSMSADVKSNIMEIRKTISRKLKDYDESLK